ncbi:hypothetical protein ZWY2020_008642 [Hordeum vulgare]|nr:hypothetical protein ZWY2020_008642 [Hordeum vulgare]
MSLSFDEIVGIVLVEAVYEGIERQFRDPWRRGPKTALNSVSPHIHTLKIAYIMSRTGSRLDEIEGKLFEERVALEAKYQKLYEPLYSKRYNIVNGVVEVDGVPQEPTSENAAERGDSDAKGIPDFWLIIQECDEPILKYLKDMKWSRIDDPKGFKLEFFFHANPFLKNSVQTKTYHMVDEDDPILEKAIETKIEWYPGKNVTRKILKKKPKKGSKNTKPITKTEESTIRDKIIPHAISWFTGEAVQVEDFDDMEDGDEDDDDEEDDKDEDKDGDEDEDEEELSKPTKKVAGKLQTLHSFEKLVICFLFAAWGNILGADVRFH